MDKEETLIEILPSGSIKFRRGDEEHNKMLMEILPKIISTDKLKELEKFFLEGNEIILIQGDEILCGWVSFIYKGI